MHFIILNRQLFSWLCSTQLIEHRLILISIHLLVHNIEDIQKSGDKMLFSVSNMQL